MTTIEFMWRKQTRTDLANNRYTLPFRTDALHELCSPDHALRPVMLQLISAGGSYAPITHWHRIEHQFGSEHGAAVQKLMADPSLVPDWTPTETMVSLAYRLNLTLG